MRLRREVSCWLPVPADYRKEDEANSVRLNATAEAANPAPHVAALDAGPFESVRLEGMIRPWADVVASPKIVNQSVDVAHGALRNYELSDLAKLEGKGKMEIKAVVDPAGKPVLAPK